MATDQKPDKTNAAEWIVYDALYAYCQAMVRSRHAIAAACTRCAFPLCGGGAGKENTADPHRAVQVSG